MIYKRGCNKKGQNGTCSKCGERGSCGVYWYKFMWEGKLIRESTKQCNDKVARQMEAAHRTSLAKGEVGIREKRVAPTPNSVRFTADGNLLVVSEPTRLHVLDLSVLKSLRVIEPPLADDFRIFHIETAPVGHVVIVGANRYMSGLLFAYDLDSGRLLFKSESGWSVSSIAWNQDATQFAAATPFLCTRTHDTVQIFGTKPWLHLRTLSARNPTSVAFSPERLFLVESGSCKGSIFDRHLGLESFDTRQWHRKKTIFLRDRDIHDSVSFANGRLVTDSGKLETRHDWLDATTWGDTVDQIAAELRSQYNIGYTPTNTRLDGTYRKLEIKNKQGYKIQSRAGYYAGRSQD